MRLLLLFLVAEGLRDELLERASGELEPVDLDGTVVKTLKSRLLEAFFA